MVVTPSNPRHPDHGVCRCPKCYDQFGYETPFDEQEILRLARLGAAVEAKREQLGRTGRECRFCKGTGHCPPSDEIERPMPQRPVADDYSLVHTCHDACPCQTDPNWKPTDW